MRFEVTAALVVGVALPVLETIRRGFGHWAVNVTTMLEDYLAGGLLVVAALLAIRAKPTAPQFLVAAWAFVTCMMTGSFAYQLEATLRGVYLEPRNTVVLVFKMILWSACVTSLVFALRCAVGTKSSGRNEMPDQSARANAGTATSDVRQKNHG